LTQRSHLDAKPGGLSSTTGGSARRTEAASNSWQSTTLTTEWRADAGSGTSQGRVTDHLSPAENAGCVVLLYWL